MTTPAVNTNATTTVPCKYTTWHFDGTSWVNQGDTVSSVWDTKVAELRPASGTSAKVNGWRPCRAWSHSGHTWKYLRPSNTHTTRFSANNITRADYVEGSFWGFTAPASVPSFPNGLVNRAVQEALLKIQNSQFNLGVFLAEFNKTAKLVGDTAFTIARQVTRFRRSNPRLWKDVVRWQRGNCLRQNWKKIPRKWLELQYGWIPLMSDILGALAFLERKSGEAGNVLHVTGNTKDEEMVRQICYGGPASESSCTLRYKAEHSCHVSLYFVLTNPQLASLASLGLMNPAYIVWEMVPYSFVVDWFMPIGPWLQSLTAATGFSFKGGSRSMLSVMKYDGVEDIKLKNNANPNGTSTSGGTPVPQGHSFNFGRSCYSVTPVPGVYVKNPLSVRHALNGLALLALAFR